LLINRTDIVKQKYYNSNGTQTTVLEENEKEKDESIGDDIEIIPANALHDDFVQLDFNECNEQQQHEVVEQ